MKHNNHESGGWRRSLRKTEAELEELRSAVRELLASKMITAGMQWDADHEAYLRVRDLVYPGGNIASKITFYKGEGI